MQVEVSGIKQRESDDPEYADFWLTLTVYNYHTVRHAWIQWEVPLSREELETLKGKLPKSIAKKADEFLSQKVQ
uniref:Uncharacterized protein n=1 Tax=viral metagenome TaxID=1070528 RepID=A0A6M3M1D6_9ZZZZ